MERIVIIGAGGHGREVADVLRERRQAGDSVEIVGFVDDDLSLSGRSVDDIPVLGDFSWFKNVDAATIRVVVAVGRPELTRRLAERASREGLSFTNAVSPDAFISTRAKLGIGVIVFPKAVVQADVSIEDHVTLNVGVTVSHDTRIERYASVNPGAHLAGNVRAGEGSYIGMGASIIHGRQIGAWTTVGAGAVVIEDLPARVTAVGVPARVIHRNDEPS